MRVKVEIISRRAMGFAVYHKPKNENKEIYLWIDDCLSFPAIDILIKKIEGAFASLTEEEEKILRHHKGIPE